LKNFSVEGSGIPPEALGPIISQATGEASAVERAALPKHPKASLSAAGKRRSGVSMIRPESVRLTACAVGAAFFSLAHHREPALLSALQLQRLKP
jgi:hypothetical protein